MTHPSRQPTGTPNPTAATVIERDTLAERTPGLTSSQSPEPLESVATGGPGDIPTERASALTRLEVLLGCLLYTSELPTNREV